MYALRFDNDVATAFKHVFFDIVDMLGEEPASPDVRRIKVGFYTIYVRKSTQNT